MYHLRPVIISLAFAIVNASSSWAAALPMLDDKRALAEQIVGSGERWVTELDDEALRNLVALGEDAVLEDE